MLETMAVKAEGRYLHSPSPGQSGLEDQILGVVLHPRQPDGPPPTLLQGRVRCHSFSGFRVNTVVSCALCCLA